MSGFLGFRFGAGRHEGAAQEKRSNALAERRARFDAEVQKGVDAAAGGRAKDAGAVFDRLEAKYEARSKRAR